MAVPEARDSDGQVILGRDVADLAQRTAHAGTEYTAWSVYDVAHTAAGTEPQKTYVGYMIAGAFKSLDEIARDSQAEKEP